MAIVVIEEPEEAADWADHLRMALPDVAVQVWPAVDHPEAVRLAVLWDDLEPLASFPALGAVVVTGAGVEHVFEQRSKIPGSTALIRLNDPSLTAQMTEWVLLAVMAHTRRWDDYRELQRAHRYEELSVPVPGEVTVGILGLGTLGRRVAEVLTGVGFRVCGWSRSPKSIDAARCHHGQDGLDALLAESDIVVCMLPLTDETNGLLSQRLFKRMKPGAYLINAARGGHLVEGDLLSALEGGQLSGATLDVQAQEPLPDDHPFWDHPRVRLTPHIATFSYPRFCAEAIAANYRRLLAGQPLHDVIDLNRQY